MAILDINLPDGDGFNLCRKIRTTNDIPIIFLTASDLESDEIKGFDLGADDYITKPFSLKLLKKRIKVILNRVGLYNDSLNYEDGFLSINFNKYTITSFGKEYNLTPTEYNLLVLFIKSNGAY